MTGKAKYHGNGAKGKYKCKQIIAYGFVFGFKKSRFGINGKGKL